MIQTHMIEQLVKRIEEQSENLHTEEATKHALVLPFLNAMGYDVFDPSEVVPEYTADFFMKNGEKVDYAIMRGELPAILIECKKVGTPLDVNKASQLGRYFNATDARIGVLTDGVIYMFFSDLEQENRMDTVPFLTVDLTDENGINYRNLRHFAKTTFDPDEACEAAANMRYIDGMQQFLEEAYNDPPEEFVRMMAKHVYNGAITTPRRQKFTHLAKVAFQGFINDRVSGTLKKASDIAANLANEDQQQDEPVEIQDLEMSDQDLETPKGIITTTEEIESYEIIKTIIEEVVDPSRIFIRDTKSYCGILLDNNNRKPICRLFFNSISAKHIRIMSNDADETGRLTDTRYEIKDVNDIADYETELKQAVQQYLQDTDPPAQDRLPIIHDDHKSAAHDLENQADSHQQFANPTYDN